MKQVVLINGLPFEIKSIYGLQNPDEIATKSEAKDVQGESAEQSKECTICLTEQSNTVIMPCGHMCVCLDCGKQIQ